MSRKETVGKQRRAKWTNFSTVVRQSEHCSSMMSTPQTVGKTLSSARAPKGIADRSESFQSISSRSEKMVFHNEEQDIDLHSLLSSSSYGESETQQATGENNPVFVCLLFSPLQLQFLWGVFFLKTDQ